MLEFRIQSSVRRDLDGYRASKYEQLTLALKSDNAKTMSEACSSLKVRPNRRKVRLKDKDGVSAANDREEREMVKGHFGIPMEASNSTFAKMVEDECLFWDNTEVGKVILDLAAVPTLPQVTTACATHTKQTAVGGDKTGSEAYSAAPRAMARHLHAL